ncbi:FAD binding domain-containing protein [Streptomyces sp. PTM05]|uniref:FAD binding domain-containing protein n=1 Tax=Streptantibioticus parmotrematis TaxID=2873249 RepID=A0ABS7R084_9ACTN|nr:FAD binding domain-containing protein [Streptantibioticus parmotrematis]MBY8888334.1 FAD binding domain-containing protein [Streptantibioticus parmotrematis]
MDLGTVTQMRDARRREQWRPGDAYLGGGTYLFSEPQPHIRRLVDLGSMGWEPLEVTPDGLVIAATCTVAQLNRFTAPPGWQACHPLIEQCCRSFLASFKIWNMATVGGNICNALPAGPMISLTAALEGEATLLALDGGVRRLPVAEFVTGNGRKVLREGELLRSVTLPTYALRSRTAFRQGSLHRLGRSAALVIGRHDPADGSFTLTVTASTPRPVRLWFPLPPAAAQLRAALEQAVPPGAWFDDIYGLPEWRRHLTLRFAEEIRAELTTAPVAPGEE